MYLFLFLEYSNRIWKNLEKNVSSKFKTFSTYHMHVCIFVGVKSILVTHLKHLNFDSSKCVKWQLINFQKLPAGQPARSCCGTILQTAWLGIYNCISLALFDPPWAMMFMKQFSHYKSSFFNSCRFMAL